MIWPRKTILLPCLAIFCSLLSAQPAKIVSLPDWFYNPPQRPGYLYAIGISDVQCDPDTASMQADLRARSLVACSQSMKLTSLRKSFSEEIGSGENARIVESLSIAGKIFSSQVFDSSAIRIVNRVSLGGRIAISLAELHQSSRNHGIVDSSRTLLKYFFESTWDSTGRHAQLFNLTYASIQGTGSSAKKDFHETTISDSTKILYDPSTCLASLELNLSLHSDSKIPDWVKNGSRPARRVGRVNDLASLYFQAWFESVLEIALPPESIKKDSMERSSDNDLESANKMPSAAEGISNLVLENVNLVSTTEGYAIYVKTNVIDDTPPEIRLTYPETVRGAELEADSKSIIVKGKAEDQSGVSEVLVNGKEANLLSGGEFWIELNLKVGENRITVRATDVKGNAGQRTFIVTRQTTPFPSSTESEDQGQMGRMRGNNYALFFAAQDYQDPSINSLEYPIADAQRLRVALLTRYDFDRENTIFVQNPKQEDVIGIIDSLAQTLGENDNLLIFYAGHGSWDERTKEGFWIPVNATFRNRAEWVFNSQIRVLVQSFKCKHVLLISDACFSGGILKTREISSNAPPAIAELYRQQSRGAMTSGALKKVEDKSPFIYCLVKYLEENKERYLSARELFATIGPLVTAKSDPSVRQVPQFGEIPGTGDEGGDFIFVHR